MTKPTDIEQLRETALLLQGQINWTCEHLHDSQEHAQIIRLEARIDKGRATLAKINERIKNYER
jgi:hypothetical protein